MAAWARAIAAPAERALIKHGLLHPDDLPPTDRRPSVEPKGHTGTINRPGPKGHTGSPNGQPPDPSAITTMGGGSS